MAVDERSAASSVETELVAFDVLHHDARVGAVIQQSHPGRPERDQPCARGLECGQALCDGFEARDAWLHSGMEVGVNEGYAELDGLLADSSL